MQGNLLKALGALAIIAMVFCFILAALGMIGAVSIGNGCYMRYDTSGKGNMDATTSTSTLNATANYTSISTTLSDGTIGLAPDPAHYGEWLNTNIDVNEGQIVKLKVEGQISLCLAYLPKNNLQFIEATRIGKSNLDDKGNPIPIPRISDSNALPISLTLDAKNGQWRNITELYNNDRIEVSVSPNYQTGTQGAVADPFKGTTVTADCTQGNTIYSPICGRYSIYSGQYVNACELKQNYWKCNHHNTSCDCFLTCWGVCNSGIWDNPDCCPHPVCDSCSAWVNQYGTMPEGYKDDGSFTFNWSNNSSNLFINYTNLQCSNNANTQPNGKCPDSVTNRDVKDKDYIGGADCKSGVCNSGQFQSERRFWYTADGGPGGKGPTGLIWRLSSSGVPDPNIGVTQFATFVADTDQPTEYAGKYKVIYNTPFNTNVPTSYLQYRLWSSVGQNNSKNTGGYVLNIKQTKCFRENGASFTDVFTDRGKVQYIVVPYAEDPNNSGKTYSATGINFNDKGEASITISNISFDKGALSINTETQGNLWMRILNNTNDYKDSFGSYKVSFSTSKQVGSFSLKVMNPLLEVFKTKVQNAAQTVFQNMICYKGDSSSCTNFFNYIKALLILYVMSYGGMYLLGFAKITQQELVIRLIKIAIVSGLMNGSTFEFFNNYLFNAITNFSDTIISNMSGYSLFTATDKVSNPFMFLDAVMSKIFFSKTFIAQLLALLGLGLSGLIYFIIVFIAIMIVIITALRAVAVYIMAFMATCILIGVAPLFITFLLFDFTRYLFDNWVKFTFRYMLEPVILMAGIIVLTQLFTIYLDFVLGYSVCWKCALPIKIPFIGTIIPIALLDVAIFCINWFAPWGMDYMSGMMGVNMQHIIALVIIAYGMYGYVEFSGAMVAKLTSAMGPSATQMGGSMSNSFETKALKQIGMDQESRAKIKDGAKNRLAIRNSTLKQAEKNND